MKFLDSRVTRRFPIFWFAFHGAIILAFLISLAVARPVCFNTSLFDILPPSHSLKSVSKADSALSSATSRAITVLSYAEDFSIAKDAAVQLYGRYTSASLSEQKISLSEQENSAGKYASFFEDISLFVDAAATAELTDFLFTNRFVLQDKETVSLLEKDDAAQVAEDSLSRIFGAFTLSDFSLLEADPFDLTGGTLTRFLSAAGTSGTMSVKDDVLACQKDGVWYVMIRGTLTPESISLAGKKSAVKDIFSACEQISARRGAQFAFSGVPFHSYESSSAAQRQVSVISTIGILLVVLLFLYLFRSAIPALVSAGAVVFSCGMALGTVLLFFREIHILTFVFGTTLIGTCVDYSIHFFVHWKGDVAVADGFEIRKKILRGIGISFTSTEICFVALFFAPFPFLKQVSVFLFTGLLSAFLCVICLYPFIRLPKKRLLHPLLLVRMKNMPVFLSVAEKSFFRKLLRIVPLVFFMLALGLLAVNRNSLKIDNNLRDMYTMSGHLLESEKITAQVLDYGSAGWYFLVEGETEEDVLQTEEAFSARLEQAKLDGKLETFLATTNFIPSQKTQKRSYRASASLIPLAKNQYENLGFPATLADSFSAEYTAAKNKFVFPQSEVPAILQSVTKNLWLGEIDGRYYSCVLPLHTTDESYFRALAADFSNVHFVNKVADIGTELNALTAMMLKLLAGAFIVALGLLFFCYPVKTVLRIALIPILVVVVTISILSACHLPLGFFSVTGLVLTFGLGLDYIIYAVEGEKSDGRLNRIAILVSFATTALSFGALALINFAPVHTIGLTVFVGLTTACVGAFAKR